MTKFDDNKNKDFLKEAIEEIENWRNYNKPEIPLKEVEDLMIKKLGVIKHKLKGGTAQIYSHNVLRNYSYYGSEGIFTIHIKGSPRNPKIRKNDFRKFLYSPLKEIINFLKEQKNV